MHYFPIPPLFLLALVLLFAFLVLAVEIGILRYAYHRIGIGQRHMFFLLALSFLGSYVNIPIWEFPPNPVGSQGVVFFHGIPYVVPVVRDWPGTIVAVNVGGAVIPVVLSIYLIAKNHLLWRSLLGVAIVALCVHLLAEPVRGVGIAVPTYIPPLFAAGAGLVLSRRYAPPLAYISGSLGTLIGADLLNLGRVQGLGAPVASIGGAGTFDGIFLTGILAVLLAGLFSRKESTA